MLHRLVLMVALASSALAAGGPSRPDFSGTWQFDPAKSSKGSDWLPQNTLVIHQFGNRLEMERMAGEAQLWKGAYITDGKSRPLYQTANEQTFISARWQKKELVVTVEHLMRAELADASMKDVDHWLLSNDAQTLTHKTSDGKTLLFRKMDKAQENAGAGR